MKCRKCNVEMVRGQAIAQTLVAGERDFPSDGKNDIVTMNYDGPGVLVSCWKCPSCGRSVSE